MHAIKKFSPLATDLPARRQKGGHSPEYRSTIELYWAILGHLRQGMGADAGAAGYLNQKFMHALRAMYAGTAAGRDQLAVNGSSVVG
jgi:hypothetical protein